MDINPIERFRRDLVSEIEEFGGRHDEESIYGGEPGDPGLAGGPESISWELHGDIGILGVAGAAAIIMEVLHPSVMAGVHSQSSFRTDPGRRARNTLGYVLRTTFGSTPAATATIDQVRTIHGHIRGTRPDGVPYEALQPELIAWVHTCIPWAVMTAFDRYRRPLSTAEKDRYLSEQAPIGVMAGADEVPRTVAELDDFVAAMRPELAVNEQTRDFIRYLAEGTVPDAAPPGRGQRFERWLGLRGSMALMPDWARDLTGLDHGTPLAGTLSSAVERFKADTARWAMGELPCVTLARRRVGASAALHAA
jgi:uncharacterized protein (DUF2236 family)